uniref:Transcription initiation factor IIF subunit alpha n=1 Tax=Phallusia mammillata TaxID=59560 RepID=A0A6F9DDH8_9ASCI|nr:general transcription factor IIF subunit 1 [Phallusia mammillata]
MSSQIDEYTVWVPKQTSKKYNVMRFNAGDRVDIRNWVDGTLSRDLSAKKIYVEEDDQPEFGEGSEYGRKQRQKARKLKYGHRESVFKVKDQPWNLKVSTIENQPDFKKKVNGKVPTDIKPKVVMKEFSGKKEGGIGEGSVYFVFTQRPDFTFEASPAEDWYNFRRKISHRTLTDEEAEAAWDKRDKIMNHLNYMARKRLHIKEEDDIDEPEGKSMNKKNLKKIKKEESDLVIHDDEDLDLYMSDSSSDDNEPSGSKKKKKKAKEKSDDEKEEALEDSDDGEHDGDEVMYASDVSSENEEVNDSRVVPKGLDELESSSSSEDEEEEAKKAEAKENETVNKLVKGSDDSASSSESGSDIEDEDALSKSALFMHVKKSKDKKGGKGSKQGSRSSTPTAELKGTPTKSKLTDVAKKLEKQGRKSPLVTGGSVLGKRSAGSSHNDSSVKRQKIGQSSTSSPGPSTPPKDLAQGAITEDAVRRYLTHKPITSKDLLKKFKTKKTGLPSEEIVKKVVKILKRLNPDKRNINGKMHLFLES